MANVLIEEQTMKDIGNAIRLKSGTEKKLKPYEMPKAIGNIPSVIYPEQYFSVPRFATRTSQMFREASKLTNFTLDFSVAENLAYCNTMFQQSSAKTIKIIGWSQKRIYAQDMFREEYSLTAITGTPFDGTKMYSYLAAFIYMPKLKEIRFVPNTLSESIKFSHSSVLSDESVQSIIDGLADLTGKTAQIIYFHTSVVKRLTDKQLQQISSKNWAIG